MASKTTKSVLQFTILLAIGVLLIWLSLRKITPQQKEDIFHAFETADYFWVGLSLAVGLLSHLLRAYRWNYLLEPVGHKTKLVNASCHVLIGYLANYGIPRMGEISRCTLAAKYDGVPFEVALGTVITERIVDLMLFILVFVLTLLLQFSELIGLANKLIFDPLGAKLSGITSSPLNIILLVVVIGGGIAGFVFLRKKIIGLLKGKLGDVIKGLGSGVSSIMRMKKATGFVVLSILIWACYFYALYFCMLALEGTSHLGQKACLTLLLFGTLGVIFSPGGLGAYPFIVGGILINTYGINEVQAVALPWLSWTGSFLLILFFGLICFIVLPLYNRKKNNVV